MKTAKKKIDLGSLEVSALVFRSPLCDTHYYVVGRDDMDYLDFSRKYEVGTDQAKRATGLNLGDYGKGFFMVHVGDCFDPPVAIIRAEHAQEAEEIFVDELPWAHIQEPDLKDYDEESLSYGPCGQPYDGQSVMVRDIQLVRVEID